MTQTDTTSRDALREQLAMVVVEITKDGTNALHGPMRLAEAHRLAEGARAAGAGAEIRPLNEQPADDELLPVLFGQLPPRGFRAHEVASIYVDPTERYVVSYVVGYGKPSDAADIAGPADAAAAAIDYLTENGDVTVFVYDRETGDMRPCERRDVEEEGSRAIAPATAAVTEQSTAALEAQRERGWQRCGHIRQHLRPAIVELIARRARDLEPHVAELSLLTRSGGDVNPPALSVHAGLDAGGDIIASETLTSDERLQQLLLHLTDIDGPCVDSIDVTSTRDAQGGPVIAYDRWEDFTVALAERGVDVDQVPDDVKAAIVASWPYGSHRDGASGDALWQQTGGPWMDRAARDLVGRGYALAPRSS